MAAKAQTLRIPQVVLGGAQSMGYPTFVNATFHANGQNKSLMDREVIDRVWVSSVRSHRRVLGDDKVERLLKQCTMPRYDALWQSYQPEKIWIYKPGPSGGGVKKYFEVNGTEVVVPLNPFLEIEKFDYVHFVKRLSRDNPRVKLDRKMTNKVWEETIANFEQKKGRGGIPPKGIREARKQAKSWTAVQYWKSRELED